MKAKVLAGALIASSSAAAVAEEGAGWYGSIASGYLWADGDGTLIGTTQSVYGGSPTFDMDDGRLFSFAAGRRLPSGWRIEGELKLLSLDTNAGAVTGLEQRGDDTFWLNGNVDSTLLMVNGLFDLKTRGERFLPYIRLGAGLARNETTATLDVLYESAVWTGTVLEGAAVSGRAFPEGREISFAWNVGFGVRTSLTDRFSLGLEYGFLDLGDAATGTDDENDALVYSDLSAQSLLLGLDYSF